MLRHILLTIALICLKGISTDTNYRLNTPLKPSAYDLVITPYFDTQDDREFTFDGEVIIHLKTDNATNQIKLHSEDLIFNADNITLTTATTTVELGPNSPLVFDTYYSFAIINLQTDLVVGTEYQLKITYRGPIRKDLNGFYRNYYIENGVTKWLGATQMETTSARKVFPCFDEPGLKATFTLAIDRPEHYKPTLANMKMQNSVALSNGYVREVFYPTPPMPTYLVAFLISEFEAAYSFDNGTKQFGVYTRPDAVNQTDYVADFGLRVVDALGEYFGIDYYSVDSQLKLDHVALIDFRAGAMENWGLVKYRESLLLYVPEESTPYYKYRVAQIVAHETTHMWFGNLVTCHWWSNTWLNEGFANYFQDYITSLIEPEVGAENMLVISSVYTAYDADDSPDSAPITNDNVNSPAEISGHFGSISYQKAGSVIRMIHHLIGDEAFRFGLNAYLNTNRFDSGYPDKLYSALSDGVAAADSFSAYQDLSITEVMSSWISQAGHPILDVDINYEDGTVSLTQRRFYIDSQHESDELYQIPITYTTGGAPNFENTKPFFIMQNRNHTFTIILPNITDTWVLLNLQETGLYRVNYDDNSWHKIAHALEDQRETIHHLNRAKIVNDIFAFFYADVVDFHIFQDMLQFLSGETDFSVWYAAVRGFKKLRTSYLGSDTLETIDAFILEKLNSIIDKLGYEEGTTDDMETLRNRLQVLELACKLGHEGCINYTKSLFEQFRDNGIPIVPSLRPVVYCNGLRYGNGGDYDFLWRRMSTTNVANEARTIGEILGCTKDEASLKRFLVSMLEEDSPVKTQDLTVPLSGVLSEYDHVPLVIEELNENYALWTSIYGTMDSVLATIASALHTEAEFDQFEAWLDACTQCTQQAVASGKKALEAARSSTLWADQHKADILDHLRSNSKVFTPSLGLTVLGLSVFTYFKL